jgi:hypothetical protein
MLAGNSTETDLNPIRGSGKQLRLFDGKKLNFSSMSVNQKISTRDNLEDFGGRDRSRSITDRV